MYQYITNIVYPFNLILKLNLKSSYFNIKLGYLTLNLTDSKQKENFMRILPLALTTTTLIGSLPIYTTVSKSVANFKIRENDLIGSTFILRDDGMYSFLENSLQHEIYVYFGTLQRARANVASHLNLSLSFPDFRYLRDFKGSLLHNLSYTFGFDIMLLPSNFKSNLIMTQTMYTLLLSSLCWLLQELGDEETNN